VNGIEGHDLARAGTNLGTEAAQVLELIDEVERHLGRIRRAQETGGERVAELEAKCRAVEQRERDCLTAAGLLEEREARLAERRDAIDAARRELVERERVLEHRQSELLARDEALVAARGELERERGVALAGLAEERDALASLRADLAAREDRLASETEELRRESRRLLGEAQAARAATAEAETKLAATVAERDAIRGQFEGLRSALEVARGETGSWRERCGELERRLESLEAHGRELATLAETRERELVRSRSALEAAAGKLAALASSVAECAPHAERFAMATAADRTAPAVPKAEEARLEARIRELEGELATRAAVPAPTAEPALESEREEIRGFAARLEEKGRRIAAMASLLRIRKERLDRVRKAMRSGRRATRVAAAPAVVQSAALIAEEDRLSDLRERLQAAGTRLAEAETEILRRYARTRSVVLAAWSSLALCALAILSWATAGALFPPSSLAACDLVAVTAPGETLDSERAAPWDAMCRALVADPTTARTVQARLAERGLPEFPVADWIGSVRMDSTGPGLLRLTAGADTGDRAVAALDTLATTVVASSARAAREAGDLPKVAIAGQTMQPGRVVFSTAQPVDRRGPRLVQASLIFSGLVAFGGLAGFVAHRALVRGRRIFEEEHVTA